VSLDPVSNTAILTLRARADEHHRLDRLFADPVAAAWWRQVEWPSELDAWYTQWSQAKTAIRAQQIDHLVRSRLAELPGAGVVELGAGLSTRRHRLQDAGTDRWLDLDLPEMIALRARLGASGESLPCSVLDRGWFAELGARAPDRWILIAEGLFYYLPRAEVDRLLADLRRTFPGATMIFDVIGGVDAWSSSAASLKAEAPIAWTLDLAYEEAMREWGLEALPGREPDRLMHETIDHFGARYGPAFAAVTRTLARVPFLRDRRSGLITGRLLPAP
jgi:O-methyltransferase involved in polyketide biosynthesis